ILDEEEGDGFAIGRPLKVGDLAVEMGDLLHVVGGERPDEEVLLGGGLVGDVPLWERMLWVDAVVAVGEEGEQAAVGRPGGMGGGAAAGFEVGDVADGVRGKDAVPGGV